jgi:hypothetical protein
MNTRELAGQKRDRRLYTRKSDADILKAFANYQFLTVELAAQVLQRNEIAVRRRLRNLFEGGILNRVTASGERSLPHLSPEPFVYFLDEKGGTQAAGLGYLPSPRWIESKSRMTVSHDLEITKFHLVLEKKLHEQGFILNWKQWRGELKDQADGSAIIPDAYFTFNDDAFFLEVVKANESEYHNGESNIERKFALYNSYRERFREKYGMDDFRVLWVLPTKERVLRLLAKIEDRLPYRRFYLTDEESYQKNILGKIWWTPRDFREATYSILR